MCVLTSPSERFQCVAFLVQFMKMHLSPPSEALKLRQSGGQTRDDLQVGARERTVDIRGGILRPWLHR